MLANGFRSFSAWFCDIVMMATSILFQLLSTVFQTDVRARGVCEENQEVEGHCFYVFTSYCDTRCTPHNSLSFLHTPSQKRGLVLRTLEFDKWIVDDSAVRLRW